MFCFCSCGAKAVRLIVERKLQLAKYVYEDYFLDKSFKEVNPFILSPEKRIFVCSRTGYEKDKCKKEKDIMIQLEDIKKDFNHKKQKGQAFNVENCFDEIERRKNLAKKVLKSQARNKNQKRSLRDEKV